MGGRPADPGDGVCSALAAPPDDFQTWLVVGDGLNGPSAFEIAPDGRIFILERSGKIKIVKNGSCCRPRSRTCRRTNAYEEGTYRFSVTGDDGIRVLVDGAEVIDGWFYQAPTTYTANVPLSEGQHTVVVEYFEHTGGAVARFDESKLAGPPP